jgi:beta-glucosidase
MKLAELNVATLAGLLICALAVRGEQGSNNVEQRVNNILNQMTLDEKLSYIGGTGFWDIKPIPRLGLPQIFMENGPLGIAHQPFEPTTRYPAGLAVAATWNPDRARGRGRQIGQDARARGFYADLGPGIDFYRTPLGGRDFEYSTGEDPYLGSQLVVSLVDAMQQQGVWANVKHFVCNDEEYRRENIDIEVAERALREIYLPPFEAAVTQGDAATVMAAFNSVNGAFCSKNPVLDTQILKQEWDFDGILMSDYQSIGDPQPSSAPANDGVLAAEAGMDLDMPNGMFMNSANLLPHITGGQAPLIPLSNIDDKVRRLLRKIVSFGFLDRPQLDSSIPLDDLNSELEALHEAQEGIVLLKNDANILPLNRNKARSIAVLGRMAQGVPPTGFGSSFVKVLNYVSELSGIQYQAGQNVRVDFIDAGTPNPATAVWEFLDSAGFIEAGLQAQYFDNNNLSGSPEVTRVDGEVNFDWTLAGAVPVSKNQATFSARWTGRVRPQYTGDHLFKVRADGGIRLYVNGQLLIDTFFSPMPPPVYGTTIPTYTKIYLQAGQAFDVRLEYRRTSGFPGDSGSLQGVQLSWTPLVVPPSISTYDAVVMCQGIDNEYDGEGLDLSFKFEDHGLAVLEQALTLPEYQDELIQNVISQNPQTIVVLHGPSNFNMQNWINAVPGLIHAWYPGENGGLALGEILFGDVNPSGKLPVTMEKQLQDNPTTGNYPLISNATTITYTEGIYVGYRGYEKNQIEPQFPFGFGLSYTSFAYSDLDITPLKGKDHESQAQPLAKVSFPVSNVENNNDDHDLAKVSFTVTNTGRRAGAEIAELYVAPVNPPVDRPIKELKGFQKVFLGPGQSRRISLELDQRSFAFFNTDKHLWDAAPGTYTILVGGSSQSLPLSGPFALKSELDSQP